MIIKSNLELRRYQIDSKHVVTTELRNKTCFSQEQEKQIVVITIMIVTRGVFLQQDLFV